MGCYFPEAKTVASLNPQEIERYKALHSPRTALPPALTDRFQALKKRVGPITSGEVWAALEELWQDSVVCWILSGENPHIEWIDLKEEKEPTEEDAKRAQIWLEDFNRENKEREEKERREFDKWESTNYPIRHFFRRLFNRP